MKLARSVLLALQSLAALAGLAACGNDNVGLISDPSPMPAVVVQTPDQGWDQQTRAKFWYTAQGAQIMPYDWFLNLEQSDSEVLFRTDANLQKMGYLPYTDTAGGLNPDLLPIGFTRASDANSVNWVGLTCAACHTAQINFAGRAMRVDGAPAMADFNRFYAELVASMAATLANDAKLGRFAGRVLGASATTAQRDALKLALTGQWTQSAARLKANSPPLAAGHARLDAFGNIFNQVLAVGFGVPGNSQFPSAPVSYPFIWDTPQHDVVQWNGSAPNGPFGLGELTRNVGEVLGVFGNLQVGNCTADTCQYQSTAKIIEVAQLEGTLRSLWSPQWDVAMLGAVDSAMALKGKALYAQQCVSCHAMVDRKDPFRKIVAVMQDVGTDKTMGEAAAARTAATGPLQGKLQVGSKTQRYDATAPGAQLLAQSALGVLQANPGMTLQALLIQFEAKLADEARGRAAGYVSPVGLTSIRPTTELLSQAFDQGSTVFQKPTAQSSAAYKARPLNGIWATAPFLHNGSVPTLWELLKPPASRATSFQVGSREFNPLDVGFSTGLGTYRFDTTLPGNSNAGHTFGTQLSDAEKRELIEYLKTL